jgi:hypothetical protein
VLLLTLRALRRRLLVLAGFAVAFLATAMTARLVTGTHDGHVELDRLFEIGGAPLASAFLLVGWVVGRFPLIAILVLMAGVFSHDRATGHVRLLLARPMSPVIIYGARFALLAAVAFAISVLVMPVFDVILLGAWAGPSTLVLIAAYVIAYGSLCALLSVWMRGDAWVTLLLAVIAIAWHALRAGGVLEGTPPGVREFVSVALPPQGALFAIENAFAAAAPIPWDGFLYVCLYAAVVLIVAGMSVTWREV